MAVNVSMGAGPPPVTGLISGCCARVISTTLLLQEANALAFTVNAAPPFGKKGKGIIRQLWKTTSPQ